MFEDSSSDEEVKKGLAVSTMKISPTLRTHMERDVSTSPSAEKTRRWQERLREYHSKSDLPLQCLPPPLQTHETVVKAMEEDPSVFEYDSLYDDMVERRRRDDPRLKKKKDTKVGLGSHFKQWAG